ncbi:MAG TPA: D-glycerate dehydrogenase [Phycisphaerae bacterium]|nr:D-glycerate dehydrogenase [Phycisphaerae bacterium]
MARPRVFVTRIIPDTGLVLLRDACEVDLWTDELPPPRDVLLARVRGVDGVLSLLTDRIDGPLLDAAGPQLKVVSNHAVGFDNIDVPAATARGIPVGNTPGILTDATADFAFALLMAAARRVVEGERYVRAGRWRTWGPSLLLGQDVHGATLGVVGYGRIGQAMARRARGFDMRVLVYDPSAPAGAAEAGATAADLETLLTESDFVSLHTPLTPETRGLMNRARFALMKPTAVLINTARGPIVDPDALYDALVTRRIFAAALDVTDPEPIPPDSPLLGLDNLIVVPHIASASVATRQKMSSMAAENLIAGVRGERLPNCVNPQVYEPRDVRGAS